MIHGMSTSSTRVVSCLYFFFQAEDGIRDYKVTGVQTCALPIYLALGLLQCQTANNARQACLHCRVGTYAASADVCGRGEQKNDGPVRFERSCLEQALGQHDRREKVDGIHVCHRLLTELPDWAMLLLSRAMHQTID